MPKVQRPSRQSIALRDPIPSGPCSVSVRNRRLRGLLVKESGCEMTFRCERCEKENLRCFVDTATGNCAGCIAVHAECSLFVPEEKWEKVQAEKRLKRLEVARLEAQLAQSKVELLEIEVLEHSYADRDLAILAVQDRASSKGSASTEESANSTVATDQPVSTPSGLSSADPGWLQAEFSDPFFEAFLFPLELTAPSAESVRGTPVPVTCSS